MMLFGIEDRPKCVSLQRPDVGFTQCAFHGGRVGNDVDQSLSRVTTAPRIVVFPARSAQEARETFKFRCLESRGLCPVPKQNRVERTDAIDTDLTVLVDGTPFRYRICPDVNRRPDKLIGLGLTNGADTREEPPRSPNLMVPKQSFETMRPVLPSVAYSMAFVFLVIAKFPSPELSVVGMGACRSKWKALWIWLEASGRSGGAIDAERDRRTSCSVRRRAHLQSDQGMTDLGLSIVRYCPWLTST
jgi:hypothetical protein